MSARPSQIRQAWWLLCAALALHVLDEATTGFLSVYNPTVASLRAQFAWFPMPQFEFGPWLAGLCGAVAMLLAAGLFIEDDARWIRPIAYVFAGMMVLNALAHTAGTLAGHTVASVRFDRPMPGFYSSPSLLAAALYLLYRLRG